MKKLFLLFLPFLGGCTDLGNLASVASDYYGGYAQGYSSYQPPIEPYHNPEHSGSIMSPGSAQPLSWYHYNDETGSGDVWTPGAAQPFSYINGN